MLPPPRFKNNIASGIYYFREGLRLIWSPELRLYLVVPLLVNCALFFILTGLFVFYFHDFVEGLMGVLPGFLEPLAWIVFFITGVLAIIVYGYSFNVITNIVAAPFYGMLAANTEKILTGVSPPDESTGTMIRRTLWRELEKLLYFFKRGIIVILVVMLLATIPIINLFAPALIGLAWAAWSMSIQYTDYSADNHQLAFKPLRQCLWKKKFSSLGFGGFTVLCSVIPVINIIAMPVAVVGGTLFWLRELKHCPEGVSPAHVVNNESR